MIWSTKLDERISKQINKNSGAAVPEGVLGGAIGGDLGEILEVLLHIVQGRPFGWSGLGHPDDKLLDIIAIVVEQLLVSFGELVKLKPFLLPVIELRELCHECALQEVHAHHEHHRGLLAAHLVGFEFLPPAEVDEALGREVAFAGDPVLVAPEFGEVWVLGFLPVAEEQFQDFNAPSSGVEEVGVGEGGGGFGVEATV